MKNIIRALVILCIASTTLYSVIASSTITYAQNIGEDNAVPNIFYGKVNVQTVEGVVKSVNFQITDQKVESESEKNNVVLIFDRKSREDLVTKQTGKFVWLEGLLGFSGQTQYIFVTGVLRKE